MSFPAKTMAILLTTLTQMRIHFVNFLHLSTFVTIYPIIAQLHNLETPSRSKMSKASNNKFSVFWNVPTQRCLRDYGVDVNVSTYGITTNVNDGWTGKQITIFPKPGLYPRVLENGTIINGGIPQKTDLPAHLHTMNKTVRGSIPWPEFSGLAVVDYEAWRPTWERNWAAKQVYQALSENRVRGRHPHWTRDRIKLEARREFEQSARSFLVATMSLCRQLRPGGLWGYYLYPDCYNYAGEITCSNRTKDFNDRILWLFESGTAIYPSGYLESPSNQTKNRDLVHGMVQEALRIQTLIQNKTGSHLPVYLYSRFRYKNAEYYSISDLRNSLEQARDLGAEGVVLWDDHDLSSSKTVCKSVQSYLNDVLGPYIEHLLGLYNVEY